MDDEVLSDVDGEASDILKKADIKRLVFRHAAIRSAVFLGSDDLLATASADNSLDIWKLGNFELMKSLKNAGSSISQVRTSSEAKQLVGSGMDGCLYLWDVSSGQPIWVGESDFSLLCCDVCSCHDGLIVSGSDMDRTIMLWDQRSDQVVHRVCNLCSGNISSVEFCPDGTRIAAACTTGPAVIYDLRSQSRTLRLDDDSVYISDLAFSKDGRNLLTTAMNGRVGFFDLASGAYRLGTHRSSLDSTIDIPACYTCCHFSNSQLNMFACGATDGSIRLWDGWTRELVLQTTGHLSIVTNCQFSPSDKSLLTTYADGKGQLTLWNLDELAKMRKWRRYEKMARRKVGNENCCGRHIHHVLANLLPLIILSWSRLDYCSTSELTFLGSAFHLPSHEK
ncbi:hypothetical protein RvY_03395 [Ramazzottius varieornatus]|uniref:Uncharacterized protein n=1 Tax=Ramazzottius varieornatus TaxID=947166 RepID=A0A1D1UNQ3_RAMVA|nr:hypothetical protein RvY_03395 [Ramazzottius varieornatus]